MAAVPRVFRLRPGIRNLSPFAPDVFVVDEEGKTVAYRAGLAVMSFTSLQDGLDRYRLHREDVEETDEAVF